MLWALLVVIVVATMLIASGWLAHDPWSLAELGRLPRSRISQAPGEQRVRLVGRVRMFETGRSAPVDHARCIGYHAIAEELQRHAGGLTGESTWVAVESEFDIADFWLEDDTGTALVQADHGADLRLRRDRYEVIADLGDRRHVRAMIVDGDRIAVCGHASYAENPDPEVSGYQLTVLPLPRLPIVISDDPALLGD